MKARCLSLAFLALAAAQATTSILPVQYANDNYYVYTYSGSNDRIYPGTFTLGSGCHSFDHMCHASDGYGDGVAFGDGFLTGAHVGIQVSCGVVGQASVSGGSEYRFQVSEAATATLNVNGQFQSIVWWDMNYVRLADITTSQILYSHQTFAGTYSQSVNLVPNHVYALLVSGNRNNLYQGGVANNTNIIGADVTLLGSMIGFCELLDTAIPRDRVPMGVTVFQNGIEMDLIRTSMTHTGRFSASTLVRGDAEIVIKPDFFLSRRVPVNLTDAPVYLPYLTFINGDIDNDNEIGPGDFGRLATAFLSVSGDPNWDAPADLDYDGEVGPGDFSILANNFLLAGE